jgi:hypothetical protein
MDELGLFTAALGLSRPWRVTRSEFDAEAAQLELYLDFDPTAPQPPLTDPPQTTQNASSETSTQDPLIPYLAAGDTLGRTGPNGHGASHGAQICRRWPCPSVTTNLAPRNHRQGCQRHRATNWVSWPAIVTAAEVAPRGQHPPDISPA